MFFLRHQHLKRAHPPLPSLSISLPGRFRHVAPGKQAHLDLFAFAEAIYDFPHYFAQFNHIQETHDHGTNNPY